MNSGIIATNHSKEDVSSNPFYEFIRVEYEALLAKAVGHDPQGLIVVPSQTALAAILKPVYTSKKFVESHILLSAHIPGLFSSVRGNPVEYRSDRLIVSSAGTKNVSPVISSEGMYDLGNSFKVLVVDKPLLPGLVLEPSGEDSKTPSSPRTGGGPSEYLAAVPIVEQDYVEKISKLRRTYLLVTGFESHLAVRIRDLSTLAASQAVRYLPAPSPGVATVQQDVERATYATLHAWIFPHIISTTEERKNYKTNILKSSLDELLREAQSPDAIVKNLSIIQSAVQESILPIFQRINNSVTPQQKINALISCQEKICEISKLKLGINAPGAEEMIAFLIIATVVGRYEQAPADLAYVNMFLSAHEELRNSKAGFAVTTLSTCVDFLSSAIV